jgi:hypothetical protein
MNRSLSFLSILIAMSVLGATSSAQAFWVARGWRGGVAVGGVRPPMVAREVYYPRCWRCAPVYPAGALAGAAMAGAAVGAAAASAPMQPAPSMAPAPAAPTAQASQASQASPANTAVAQAAAPNAAATQCARGLPADSKMIYDASVQNMKSLATLRDTVTEQTRSLVMSGKIGQAGARPAAEKAGTCLRLMAQ